MLTVPFIHPTIIEFYPGIAVRWYGLMYVIGFAIAYVFGKKSLATVGMHKDTFMDLISTVAMGIIAGGRLGYMLLYQSGLFFHHPLSILALHQGGMSFHGALLGGMLSIGIFATLKTINLLKLIDFVVPLLPPGLALGRLGNFINGELWGRPTTVPWAMIFSQCDAQPRHPSQLYEMLGEGVLLWALLHWHRNNKAKPGMLGVWFLVHYAWIRFVVEFWREPDAEVGFVWMGMFSMGQLLSSIMLLTAAIVGIYIYKQPLPLSRHSPKNI